MLHVATICILTRDTNSNDAFLLKFIYSEKATIFFEISTVDLSYVSSNGQMEISQNFVAFSEYMNFKRKKKIGASYAFRDGFLFLSTLG